ncbi:ABC transporter ATP-binding protein [Rhizosaccharibacter radicis]|uniref:ABC transporter ATP-binding protein n=1 Tax=Rhizosaccharibacter radicis TaxID=2782605 RepID=A0ABT1VUX3_9PROT|nr:ABC transporter ATP-binding protein [Acetobacteraceae bacterium KSS12]
MPACSFPPAPDLVLDALTLRFGAREIFAGLSAVLPGGRCTVLLGTSGVGKSSLLRIVAGLEQPTAGRVTAADGAPVRDRVAYMGQRDLLLPWLDVAGNVMLGDRLRGRRPDRGRAGTLLERVGLAGRERALPAQLSGGMRQRVALARTLYENRPFVLMDEPFSALDSATRTRMQDLAAELLRGRTVLLITHDPLEACRLGDTLAVLSGHPARLQERIPIPGPTPRPPDDPALLAVQGRLMRQLMTEAA